MHSWLNLSTYRLVSFMQCHKYAEEACETLVSLVSQWQLNQLQVWHTSVHVDSVRVVASYHETSRVIRNNSVVHPPTSYLMHFLMCTNSVRDFMIVYSHTIVYMLIVAMTTISSYVRSHCILAILYILVMCTQVQLMTGCKSPGYKSRREDQNIQVTKRRRQLASWRKQFKNLSTFATV